MPSLHSLATPEQLVVDPTLAGYWRIDEEDSDWVYYIAADQEGPWMRVETLTEGCEDRDEEGEFHVALTHVTFPPALFCRC